MDTLVQVYQYGLLGLPALNFFDIPHSEHSCGYSEHHDRR